MSDMAEFKIPSAETIAHIKQCYFMYRNTEGADRQGHFFSPDCVQICRPIPSYAATNRGQIVQYVKEAAAKSEKPAKSRGVYTIRPLHPHEHEFGADEITTPIGLTVEVLKKRAVQESWVGMRVDLWDEGEGNGLLVKVQYWFRLEDIPAHERVMEKDQVMGWRQCLHDIMYLGPKDGTEGEEGLGVLERSS
jgi:hypothetical protein